MSVSQVLESLYSLGVSSPATPELLHNLFQYDAYLLNLQGSELTRLLDFLDEVIDAIPTADDISRQCLRKLQVLCEHHMILPSSYIISGTLARIDDPPTSSGFADVWKGTHRGREVCIKRLRVHPDGDRILKKAFFKEVVIWKRLKHPNVVPFIGATMRPLQIVSEWMPNGTLTSYVEKNPDANRIGLLLDVAEGLNYLHANHTIHGDLKGPNILIDHNGRARLVDFGLASIVHGASSISTSRGQGYTARWTAPEILMGGNNVTREADIFSFGMVVIEVFTGEQPFGTLPYLTAMFKIADGERPVRPLDAHNLGLVDSVWDMTLNCWHQNPAHRPTGAEVVIFLRKCNTLRAADPSSLALAPWQPTGNVDDGTDYAPISPIPTDANLTPTQPFETSPYSSQLNFQTEEISELGSIFDIAHSPVSRTSFGSSGEPLTPTVRTNDHPETGRFADDGAARRIDEISEDLLHGNPRSRWRSVHELRRLCGLHFTIPTSYHLEGVMKEGDCAQWISQPTEIWRGRYNDKMVALKVLRVPRDDPHVQKTRSRFCKEVVLMKQLKHDNILPFYGVSTTVSDFCLVFPWYENGNIMDYLKRKPDINRFGLLSNAASGLRFLHENYLVHSALKPSHILVDDNGTARLATGGRSSIVVVPDTSIAGRTQSAGDGRIDDYRYWAPEIQWPEDRGLGKILLTTESDVYGMGMVVYEVLTGNKPYSECNNITAPSNIRAGKIPHRPSNGIANPVWEFLEECWNRDIRRRPSTIQVCDAFSRFRNLPRATHTVRERPATGELPGKLRLLVPGIKIPPNESGRHFSVKLKYGDKDHTTSPTTQVVRGNEHTWNCPETWLIETDKLNHEQFVSVEVLLRAPIFRRDRVYATGKISLLDSINKPTHLILAPPDSINKPTHSKLEAPDSAVPAVLKIFLTEAL